MSSRPRRLLLLCYYFPPTPSVGSVRVGALAKYLPRYGWEPTVVTPHVPGRVPGSFPLVETEDRDVAARFKRLVGLKPSATLKDQLGAGLGSPSRLSGLRARLIEQAKAVALWPDSHRGWSRIAAQAAEARGGADFDAILTSSPPVSVHLAGRRLRERGTTPWVADLRDLWAGDYHSRAPAWRLGADRWLERRTLRRADALTSISEPLAQLLAERYQPVPARAILNGFDPEGILSPPLTRDFTLTHTGTMSEGRRDPSLLFSAVARLIAAGRIPRERIQIRLFSRREPWLLDLVARFGLSDVVTVSGWVSWADALRAQQESQALVLFHWGTERQAGFYTGKIFEYLAARRPILVLGGARGVLDGLLEETQAGVHLSAPQELEQQLTAWYDSFAATGAVPYVSDEARIARYSHLRMAQEFAELLDGLTLRGGRRPG